MMKEDGRAHSIHHLELGFREEDYMFLRDQNLVSKKGMWCGCRKKIDHAEAKVTYPASVFSSQGSMRMAEALGELGK